jgi:nicotinate phosphoribosyltransferase
LKQRTLKDVRGNEYDLVDLVMDYKSKVNFGSIPNEGELAAFIAYAIAFPNSFLALVDTYNTLKSGIPNFVLVSLSLFHLGYTPIGIDEFVWTPAIWRIYRKKRAKFSDKSLCSLIFHHSND